MTLKEQLRDEFDEKFPRVMPGFRVVHHTFLDQAYDRIREESLREARVALPGWDDGAPDRSSYSDGYNRCSDDSHAAIQSLITKKEEK